jgi:hypothetical protein
VTTTSLLVARTQLRELRPTQPACAAHASSGTS